MNLRCSLSGHPEGILGILWTQAGKSEGPLGIAPVRGQTDVFHPISSQTICICIQKCSPLFNFVEVCEKSLGNMIVKSYPLI